MAVENGTNCIAHGGVRQESAIRDAALKNYRLQLWEQKVGDKAGSNHIKSLRDEIGILRVILEERLNRCKDATDLMLQSGPIGDMVMKIDKVVTSCHKLEGSMGQLLDKAAILQFAGEVISILGDEIQDEELLARIADRITNVID
jgi:hypothetical protein